MTYYVSRLQGDYTADKEANWPWAPTLLSSRTTPSKQRGRKKTSQQIYRFYYRLGKIYVLSLHIILNLFRSRCHNKERLCKRTTMS